MPDLASVADLVLGRRAGLDVVLPDALSGEEHDRLPPVASREAYRVVQEGSPTLSATGKDCPG